MACRDDWVSRDGKQLRKLVLVVNEFSLCLVHIAPTPRQHLVTLPSGSNSSGVVLLRLKTGRSVLHSLAQIHVVFHAEALIKAPSSLW